MDLWAFEKKVIRKGFTVIAGIDEAGRGPLAGPVVAAAVILPRRFRVARMADSKQLTPKRRSEVYEIICRKAVGVGIGIIDPCEIDRINIFQAALAAMAVAVENLNPRPLYLLIDGKFPIYCDLPQEPIVKGDTLSISIAAASIVAKVTRDRLMEQYHDLYPHYGFDRHKGYATACHRKAIQDFGPCPIHRASFKGVREYC